MEQVILVIHLMLAVALVGVVLLQRSEGGALGIGGGGGGGGMSGFLSGRSSANLLTRTTAVLAAAFMLTSLTLAWLSARERAPSSILDRAPVSQGTTEPAPAADGSAAPGVDQTGAQQTGTAGEPASTAPATTEPAGTTEPSVPLGGQ
jgi:preprotein translocase subunit SecG